MRSTRIDGNRYRVETYFFMSRSLGLDAHAYPHEQFCADVQCIVFDNQGEYEQTISARCRSGRRSSIILRLGTSYGGSHVVVEAFGYFPQRRLAGQSTKLFV
jgi:hypothetical protein